MNFLDPLFGPVWVGAGTLGFFGEGYWYHKWVPKLSFAGATFVAKTTTFYPNEGNMPLSDTFEPVERFPRCIAFDLVQGAALNAVGLSGPGFEALLATWKWQDRRDPFFLSFMPIGETEDKQWEEAHFFGQMLLGQRHHFKAPRVGLQINVSCPNVGADLSATYKKAVMLLDTLAELPRHKTPLVVKLNTLVAPEEAAKIAAHPACAGLCVSNTAPFASHEKAIPWGKLFPGGSPLAARGFPPGGLSGAPLFPVVYQWMREFRKIDRKTPVNVGGGIMHESDVSVLKHIGADSVSFATVAMLRPWRVPGIINHALNEFDY